MTTRDVYANQATIVGDVLSMNIKTGDKKNPRPGDNPKWEMLEAEIGACGSKIKVAVWPTKKDQQKHQTLYRSIQAGAKVLVRGTLQEQVSEQGRIFRQVQAFVFEAAGAHEQDKLVYYVGGHLGHPVKTSADGKEIVVSPVTVVRKFEVNGEERQEESTLHIHPDDAMLKTLYEKVSPGRIIQARGYIVNKISFDEFGAPDGYKTELTVAKLEVRDEQNAMWLVVSDGMPASLSTSNPPPPTGLQPTPPKDKDIPF